MRRRLVPLCVVLCLGSCASANLFVVSDQGNTPALWPPMEADDRTLALWRLIKAQASNLGLKIESISTGGCSDGNYTSAQGAPTIDGMGPVGANAHRQDEYVEVGSIAPQIQLIASVCRAIAQEKA